jgi:hypothetical protein
MRVLASRFEALRGVFSRDTTIRVARQGAIALVLLGACCAQNVAQPQGTMPSFGTTVVVSSGLTGKVYFIKPGTEKLPKFKNLEPAGEIYTTNLNVRHRDFEQGFPGVLGHVEWFAIDYTGRFWIERPGKYHFRLASADGSKLYVDDRRVINDDGHHPPVFVEGSATLRGGVHSMRVSYCVGPRRQLTLILEIAGPGEEWRVFSTDEFRPTVKDNNYY